MKKSYRDFVKYFTDQKAITYNNGTKAAQAAGYKGKNVNVTASKLLAKPEIKIAIAERSRGPMIKEVTAAMRHDGKWFTSKVGVIDKIGSIMDSLQLNSSVLPKYFELLAKLQGWFESNITTTTICGITLDDSTNSVAFKFAQKISKSNVPNEIEKPSDATNTTT